MVFTSLFPVILKILERALKLHETHPPHALGRSTKLNCESAGIVSN